MSCVLVFYVNMMNWGLKHFGVGNWDQTEWQVYDNGRVIMDETYDPICEPGHDDWLINRDKSTVARSTGRLPAEAFEELMRFVTDEFPYIEERVHGCDGTGFDMRSYINGGKIAHRFNGYIYGIKPMERIINILDAVHTKPQKPEQWLEVNGKHYIKLKELDEGKNCRAYIVGVDGRHYLAECFDGPQRFEAELHKHDEAVAADPHGQELTIVDRSKLCIMRRSSAY